MISTYKNLKTTTNNFVASFQQRIEACLQQALPSDEGGTKRLQQAMRYAVLNGGKRVRPLLVYATGLCLNIQSKLLDQAAIAVEYIHCYSLVHDDLPVMDDDDLRRGKPTCHKAFDEATAMLAGDALQAEAFSTVAMDKENCAKKKIRVLEILGNACGALGMAGGQAHDLGAMGKELTLQELEKMHRMKTGALIKASIQMGAVIGEANSEVWTKLTNFAEYIGLAFQIHDDILDVEGDTTLLGKQQGRDQALNKPTYPIVVGMKMAKQLAQKAYYQALDELQDFGEEAGELRLLAAYIVSRDH